MLRIPNISGLSLEQKSFILSMLIIGMCFTPFWVIAVGLYARIKKWECALDGMLKRVERLEKEEV